MSSTFWFLLEFTVLLALTAVVFGWLGWMWRGTDRTGRVTTLEMEIEEQRRLARAAMDERDAARAEARDSSMHVSDAARLLQESEALENANNRLRDDLAAARRELALLADSDAKTAESRAALEVEITKLQAENERLRSQSAASDPQVKSAPAAGLDQLQAAESRIAALEQQIASFADASDNERSRLQSDLQAALATVTRLEADLAAARAEIADLHARPVIATTPAENAAPTPKAKTTRPKTAPAAKRAAHAPAASAQEKLAQIQHDLAPQLDAISALTQERDDWQRRVATLGSTSPPDPAGLALARRSLAGSEERLNTAHAAVESLRNQQRALEKAIAQAAELASVPDDDLTKIKGIKKVLRDQLHALGIRTWRQIAAWNDDDLHAFSELLAFKNRPTRDHWQDQARQLMQA